MSNKEYNFIGDCLGVVIEAKKNPLHSCDKDFSQIYKRYIESLEQQLKEKEAELSELKEKVGGEIKATGTAQVGQIHDDFCVTILTHNIKGIVGTHTKYKVLFVRE